MKRIYPLFVLSLLAPAHVLAQDTGFYVGAAYANVDFDTSGFDDDESGYNLDFGFSLTDNFAIEASYHDLGGQSFPNNLYSYEVEGIAVAVVAQYHIDEVSLYGKFGIMNWDTDGQANATDIPAFPNADDSTLLLGIGAAYQFSEQFSVNLEYEVVDDFDITGADLQQFDQFDSLGIFSLGIRYHF